MPATQISQRIRDRRGLEQPSRSPKRGLEAPIPLLGWYLFASRARLYPVDVAAFAAMSSHYHGLLVVESAQRLADFMRYLDSNLALELGRLYDWRYRFWGSRYSAITISDEEEAQVRRLKYILAAGAKEGLVAKVTDWPGVHCGRHLLEGTKLEGTWINHTYEYRQRRSGKDVNPEKARTTETLRFSRLQCWDDLAPEKYQERVADLIEQAEREAATIRQAEGKEVVGRKAILRKSAHYAPAKQKNSRRPLFFAASKEAYKHLIEAFKAFLSAYMEASSRLRDGDRGTVCGGRNPGCPGPPAQIPASGFPALGSCLRY